MIWSNPLYITKGKDFVKPKLSYLERNKWKSGISFFSLPPSKRQVKLWNIKNVFLTFTCARVVNLQSFFSFFLIKECFAKKLMGLLKMCCLNAVKLPWNLLQKKKKILYSFLIFGFCAKTFNWLPNL